MATYTKLTLGSRGDEVKRLQTRLNAHGANLAVDGVFGNLTLDAVKRYQKSRGLAADGVVGDLTWGRLLEGTAQPVTAAVTTVSGGSRRGGVSDETAKALAELEKGYKPGQSVTDAEDYLRQLQGQRPGDYQSPYGDELAELLSRIRGRKPFSYDLNADMLYRQYRDQYVDLGRRAMTDTMGRAAGLTGGYGSTYSQNAGQQAYDGYLQQLNSKVPELYRLALERYNAEGDELATEYGLLSDRERAAYDRWRDAMDDYEAQLSAARSRYDTERDFDYGRWQDQLKYWQDRSDDEYEQWWQQTQFAAQQAARQAKLAAASGSRSGGSSRSSRSSGKSGGSGAGAGQQTPASAAGTKETLVHIPGYGEVTLADARAMVASGMLAWVMKDNRKGPVTDEKGRFVARMRRPPVKGPFRMVT